MKYLAITGLLFISSLGFSQDEKPPLLINPITQVYSVECSIEFTPWLWTTIEEEPVDLTRKAWDPLNAYVYRSKTRKEASRYGDITELSSFITDDSDHFNGWEKAGIILGRAAMGILSSGATNPGAYY